MSNTIVTVPADSVQNSVNSEGATGSLVLKKVQLASLLGCSTRHLDNLTRRGLLPRVRLGRSIRYRRDAVIAALRKLEGGAA